MRSLLVAGGRRHTNRTRSATTAATAPPTRTQVDINPSRTADSIPYRVFAGSNGGRCSRGAAPRETSVADPTTADPMGPIPQDPS